MLYDTILARSFSKHEQKKLGYGALIGCCFLAFTFCSVLKPFLGPLALLNLRLSTDIGPELLTIKKDNATTSQQVPEVIKKNNATIPQKVLEVAENVTKKIEPVCNFMERTDFCDIGENVRVDGDSSSVYINLNSIENFDSNSSWRIRPYARKSDATAMRGVREWSVKSSVDRLEMPQCTRNHDVPAVLFSSGGYTGNHFHDFTDVVIPLYITSRKFNGEVKFLITDKRSLWISKFKRILEKLSKYEPIDIDKENEVHCFPSLIVGLKRHQKELSIDPFQHSYSMRDFKQFLRSSYSLKREKAIKIEDGRRRKPRLLIVSRKRTRSFTNVREISKMARRLGYKVIVAEPDRNISRVAEMVNSCDVMMGVHGAGLTNIVFLPENAIFIQIVPFGGVEWVSTNFFGNPSKEMNIKYLEYKISLEESTLIKQYPLDHVVLRDPYTIGRQGWAAFKSIYLDKQNVNLNLNRFRPTLLKALELLR